MKKGFGLLLFLSIVILKGYAQKVGDEFVANNSDGIPVHYRIISTTDNTVAVCGGKKAYDGIDTLVIPEKAVYQGKEYIVTEIATRAFCSFWGVSKVKHIVFPSTLVAINKDAFFRPILEEIILPEGLVTIGKNAFNNCAPLSLYLPSSLKMIGKNAFGDSSISKTKLKTEIKNLPSFVTIENCGEFGLSKESVERYYSYHPVTPVSQKTPQLANNSSVPSLRPNPEITKQPLSDVDKDIPFLETTNKDYFAIIIANEDYQRESKVDFAKNDGKTFMTYCRQILGLPEKNVHLVENATLNNIIFELDWLQKVCKAYSGEASVIFYYAGHGVPNESDGKAYILPIDGIGNNMRTCLSTEELYKALGDMNAKNITVLMDACFSGAKRNGEMISSARGVAIKAKPSAPKGKMVVLTAAQGDETAYSYKDQHHGLFTYFLLKKLKESLGSMTLGELSDYVEKEVARYSIVENGKSQTPTVNVSSTLDIKWRDIKLK